MDNSKEQIKAQLKEELEKQRFLKALAKSTTATPVEYKIVEVEKPRNYLKIVSTTALITAISFLIITKGYGIVKDTIAFNKMANELATPVENNIQYYGYNTETKENNWDYKMSKIAFDVLNNHPDVSIDARIYGCYMELNPYNKLEHMNELFHFLNYFVYADVNKYPSDVVNVCKFDNFTDYLNSLNLSLEDYEEKMNKLITAEAKKEEKSDKVLTILEDIYDTESRDGSSR